MVLSSTRAGYPRATRSTSTTRRSRATRRAPFQFSAAQEELKSGGTAAMLASTSNNRSQVKRLTLPVKSEAGFSLIEMVVAMLIMLVGLLALASAIGYAFMASNRGRNITNTKLLVVAILEQMETLRNTQQLTFGQISNTGSVDNTGAPQNFGGFATTFQPVSS